MQRRRGWRGRFRTAQRVFWIVLVAAVGWALPGLAEAAPMLGASTVTGIPGAQVAFSVAVTTDGASVASMQNDTGFDPVRTPIARTVTGDPDCTVNPASNKLGAFAFEPFGCTGTDCASIRALLFSIDTNLIPDGVLYSCAIDVAPDAPVGTYALSLSGVLLVAPDATAIPGVTSTDGSVVVVAPCGDGTIQTGEQCDDGNQLSGDTCPADCTYTAGKSAIRGNGHAPHADRSGCQVEWFVVTPTAQLDRFGLPSAEQHCVDQDPSCDADPTVGRCRFTVVACASNDDPALACAPAGLTRLDVLEPRPARAHDPATMALLAADVAAVENAFVHLLDPRDPAAGYSHPVPLPATARDLCSAPFSIDVPPPHGNARAVLKLTTRSADAAAPRGRTDRSTLRLVCDAAG